MAQVIVLLLCSFLLFSCDNGCKGMANNFQKNAFNKRCNPESTGDIDIPGRPAGFTVTNVEVVNNEIIATGTNLTEVTSTSVTDGSTANTLSITEKTESTIRMVSSVAINFILEATYNFLFTNANASVAFPLTFSSSQVTMISSRVNTSRTFAQAMSDCRDLTAACEKNIDGTNCGATTYSDWRVPYREELIHFVNMGIANEANYYWTMTPTDYGPGTVSLHAVRLSSGELNQVNPTSSSYQSICVR
jgi:hypothetical protein